MSIEVAERLPNTVTKCHQEIRRLREAATDPDMIALIAERDELKDRVEAAEKEVSELEERVEALEDDAHPDMEDAIHVFLDECERVGPLQYDVPQSDGTFRAIIRLHDAVGRHP